MNIRKIKRFIIQNLSEGLSKQLSYHGVKHTLGVLYVCNQYIKRMKIAPSEAYLLRTAALLHDTGFLWTFENHEDRSITYAREILPQWNYSKIDIEKIAGMIRATKIPQQATNILEQIIGDSDLDYLGTESFGTISETLYLELLVHNKISSREDWDKMQIRFLQNHRYHTAFAQKYREPVKQKHLEELMNKSGQEK